VVEFYRFLPFSAIIRIATATAAIPRSGIREEAGVVVVGAAVANGAGTAGLITIEPAFSAYTKTSLLTE
jgi:hypothetical protein